MTAKLGFRKWLELEAHKEKLIKATETSEFPDTVFAFLSVAFDAPANEKDSWENTVFHFFDALQFKPKEIPFIKDSPAERIKPADWDYEGRAWAYWSHTIAKAYGWTLEYIADLDVNEALAHVQEILTTEQLEKEFVYGLSEIAYPYNKSTKKNHFKPMSRPYWMRPIVPPVHVGKIRKDLLPMGMVKDVSGMPQEYNPLRNAQKKTETQETNPSSNP